MYYPGNIWCHNTNFGEMKYYSPIISTTEGRSVCVLCLNCGKWVFSNPGVIHDFSLIYKKQLLCWIVCCQKCVILKTMVEICYV